MKLTEKEMLDLLIGYNRPSDAEASETIPAYLVRQFGQLHTQIAEMQNQLDINRDTVAEFVRREQQLTAENAALKNGMGFFSYGSDAGYEEHDTADEARAAAEADIEEYRGYACDGWSEETDRTVWGVIMQRATMINERPRTEEDGHVDKSIKTICDFALLPAIETQATDAWINVQRIGAVKAALDSVGGMDVDCVQDAIGRDRDYSEAFVDGMLNLHGQITHYLNQLRAGKV